MKDSFYQSTESPQIKQLESQVKQLQEELTATKISIQRAGTSLSNENCEINTNTCSGGYSSHVSPQQSQQQQQQLLLTTCSNSIAQNDTLRANEKSLKDKVILNIALENLT